MCRRGAEDLAKCLHAKEGAIPLGKAASKGLALPGQKPTSLVRVSEQPRKYVSINCHLLQPQSFLIAVSCPTPLTAAIRCGTHTHNATNSSNTRVPESDCTQHGIALTKHGDGREATEHLALLPGANSIHKTRL